VARSLIPFAICYDFDGTLAPGNMQERDFIPSIQMTTKSFWTEVKQRCEIHNADNILIYMGLMLEKAKAAHVSVRKTDFSNYGHQLSFFPGVDDWFSRINKYGKDSGLRVTHHIISSGIREMIAGTKIAKYFKDIYASSFCYDHHGVAEWPALALNYTTKTQYLFRINKGVHQVYDHAKINDFVPHDKRPVPFSHIVFIGDGETDIPCFRLVKEQGGHSIAVFRPHTAAAKARSEQILNDGRVQFVAPADYSESKTIDRIIKSIMEKVAASEHLKSLEWRAPKRRQTSKRAKSSEKIPMPINGSGDLALDS
jgi:phosphoserine phosphatase